MGNEQLLRGLRIAQGNFGSRMATFQLSSPKILSQPWRVFSLGGEAFLKVQTYFMFSFHLSSELHVYLDQSSCLYGANSGPHTQVQDNHPNEDKQILLYMVLGGVNTLFVAMAHLTMSPYSCLDIGHSHHSSVDAELGQLLDSQVQVRHSHATLYFFSFLFPFLMCLDYFASMYVCVPHAHPISVAARRQCWSPWNWSHNGCELP